MMMVHTHTDKTIWQLINFRVLLKTVALQHYCDYYNHYYIHHSTHQMSKTSSLQPTLQLIDNGNLQLDRSFVNLNIKTSINQLINNKLKFTLSTCVLSLVWAK